MSSLWTPDGEHRVPRDSPAPAPGAPPPDAGAGGGPGPDDDLDDLDDLSPEERQAMAGRLDELRRQLVSTPAEVVVANHAYGLFELAAIHLSQQPPNLEQARLAVDALGAVVGGLAGRLGQAEPQLNDALAQIRLTYVQISELVQATADGPGDNAPPS